MLHIVVENIKFSPILKNEYTMIYNEKKEEVLKRIEKIACDCFGFKEQFKVTVKESTAPDIDFTDMKTIKVTIESENDKNIFMADISSFYVQTANHLISYFYVFERSLLSFKMENKNTLSFHLAISHIYGLNTPKENVKWEFRLAN